MCQLWASCVKANSYRGRDWLPSGCVHAVRAWLWGVGNLLHSGPWTQAVSPAEPFTILVDCSPEFCCVMQLPSDPVPSLLAFTPFHPCHSSILTSAFGHCQPPVPLTSSALWQSLAIFASLVLYPRVTNANSFFKVSSSLRNTPSTLQIISATILLDAAQK